MRRMLSLAVVAVLASSGAASAQEVTNPLYPLKVGAVWTYKVSGGTIQVKVEKTEKIGNDECYKLETSAQGKVAATEDVVVKSDGVYRTAVNGLRPDAAVCFLNTKETSWKVNTKVQGQEVTGEFTKKEEDVTVPAGVYKGATLVESKDFKIGGMETSIKMWFVKDIGIVKLEFKLGGQDASLELDKYEAPK